MSASLKLDNRFIVESPLQALVAVELSLQFSGKNNVIIYRLIGKRRERNDAQISKVIELGNWQSLFSRVGRRPGAGGPARR